ncbi:MAG TPA: ATP-binding protein [Vicinamibacterales bacterium]|nr:ATP-binding protein [Vicinamibacterales bacterium]
MNEHLRIAIDHLHEGVQVIGFDWRYLYVNDTAALHGRSSAIDLIGCTMQDCYPGIAESELFGVLREAMQDRQPRRLRNLFEYPNGGARWFDLRIEAVPAGICVLSMDVTEDQQTQDRLREVERQLLQAQKMEAVGRLAGGIAHDFNNQLTVILGLTQLLLEDVTDVKQKRDLGEIEAAAQRSAALTKQLLAFSRRQVFHIEPVYLPAVVRNVSRLLERILGEDIRCELDLDPGTELVLGDAGQFEHVLTNLAVNARDAMPEGGQLMVSTGTTEFNEDDARQHPMMQKGRYTVLSVADSGHGMDDETKAQIFEPFFTTKEAGKGTGLGLSTVYGVVKQMNGFIWVYSEPGHGTTFRLYFPITSERPDAAINRIYVEKRSAGTARVLVVEDDPGVRELVARTLRQNGYHVTVASSAEEASDYFDQPDVSLDLVLVDVILPGQSGPMLLEQFERFAIPVIFMSGYSAAHVQNRGRLGSFPLLTKPFSSAQLVSAVEQALAPSMHQ